MSSGRGFLLPTRRIRIDHLQKMRVFMEANIEEQAEVLSNVQELPIRYREADPDRSGCFYKERLKEIRDHIEALIENAVRDAIDGR